MTEEELALIEEKIYTDLSPVLVASRRLSKKLPADGRTLSDEAWHFYHFETDDYAMVKRTIECACKEHGWCNPLLLSKDEFLQKLQPSQEASASGGKKSSDKKKLSDAEIMENIKNLVKEKNNKPVFVYTSYIDIKSGNGIRNSDNSASKLSANLTFFQVMETFILSCSRQRSIQNCAQIGNLSAFQEKEAAPVYNRVFFVSYGPSCILPDNLRASLCSISYPSLTAKDFYCLLWEYHLRKERFLQAKRVARGVPAKEIRNLKLTDKLLEWYANSMAGLEELVVRRLLSSLDGAFASNYADYTDKETVDKVITDYKNEILKQHGRLEAIQVKKGDRVTGLDTIQKWLNDHQKAIGNYNGSPTGILLVGIPGTGKSATAKEAAKQLNLPLVQLDMSRILGGRVGDSEKGMREMLDDLRFVAPCVLWIDEVEKAMSGASGQSGDGGTIRRLFGMLLTFIQDNDRPVFTVTTANDIANLPPEFFRNGRFDQTFCLMMPNYEGCCSIMQLKLNDYADKLGWKHEFQLNESGLLFDQCVGSPEAPRFLTGADIEAHIQELFWQYRAGNTNTYPGIEDMKRRMRAVSKTVRAQALPAAPHTMEDIAKRYLDMIQRGMTMAGSLDDPYSRDKLNLNKICYYSFEDDPLKKEIPLCLEEPDKFKAYKLVHEIPAEDRQSPAAWYDARFFYELVPVMSKVAFLDKDITMQETRSEYWRLMKHLNAAHHSKK